MQVARIAQHLFALPGSVARAFPAASLENIEAAIRQSERLHGGEIRFAVEAALHPHALLRGQTARQRAVQVFAELGVWDTEHNNGVLIYLLLADRDVEIVADRGFNGKVSSAEWEAACRTMESALRGGRFEMAVTEGIGHIGGVIARHFPPRARDSNELPDKPALL